MTSGRPAPLQPSSDVTNGTRSYRPSPDRPEPSGRPCPTSCRHEPGTPGTALSYNHGVPLAPPAVPHVVVVGGGFAGLAATRGLARAPVRVTLVDRHNVHVFQPLLYQVATAGLGATDVAAPLRQVLRGQQNATVL